MNILAKEELMELGHGTMVSGMALVLSYTVAVTKTKSKYIQGMLECKGSVGFKAWGGSSSFFALDGSDHTGMICRVEAEVNEWQGTKSLIVKEVFALDESDLGVSRSDFYLARYNTEKYFEAISSALEKTADTSEKKVFEIVVKDIEGRFKEEFAASFHHDNCVGGLIGHTYKVMRVANICSSYKNIVAKYGMGMIMLACALHDIGKVKEYFMGSISDEGKMLSHHTFGVMMLFEKRDEIVGLIGEENFNLLLSVVEQHHGEYEERPRTVLAYIVHTVDLLESRLQGIDQNLEEVELGQIVVDNFKLS